MLGRLLLDGLAISLAAGAAILTLRRLPVLDAVVAIGSNARRAFRAISARRVSDHWREQVVPRYTVGVMAGTVRLAGYLAAASVAFVAVFLAIGLPFADGPAEVLGRLLLWETQAMAALAAMLLFVFLSRSAR